MRAELTPLFSFLVQQIEATFHFFPRSAVATFFDVLYALWPGFFKAEIGGIITGKNTSEAPDQ